MTADSVAALREQLAELQKKRDAGAVDAAQYERRKAAIERKLLDTVLAQPQTSAAGAGTAGAATPPRAGAALWAGLAVFALVVAGAGYWWTGSPAAAGNAPEGFAEGPDGAASSPHATGRAEIEALAEKLSERLKQSPDDAEGWAMLGRTYMALANHGEALKAYRKSLELRPNDAGALADVADIAAVANGRSLDGEPTKLLERALKIEPDNLKALALMGTAAFNRNDYAGAVRYWDRIVAIGEPDSPIVEMARGGAVEARERGKLPPADSVAALMPGNLPTLPGATAAAPAASAGSGEKTTTAATAGGDITGTVKLSPALKAQTAPDDIVFIFARPAEGSRAPLAILRKQVKDLPFEFRLDDSLSMSPSTKLSGAGRVVVGARISKKGQAMAVAGDLQGQTAPVPVGSHGLTIEIATQVP